MLLQVTLKNWNLKFEISHPFGCSTKCCCPRTAFQMPHHPYVGCSVSLIAPHKHEAMCPWANRGQCEVCKLHEGWSSPLLSHSRSLDPAFDLRPSQYSSSTRVDHHSVSEDNYSPDRYTHTHSGLHLCTVDACTYAGMHEQMLTSTSGGWWVDMQGGVYAHIHLCTMPFTLNSFFYIFLLLKSNFLHSLEIFD